MVGVDFQIGKQKRLIAGLVTAAIGLDSYEYRVDLRQCFRVITLKNPALLRAIVLIQNAQVDGLLTVRPRRPHAWKVLARFSSGC